MINKNVQKTSQFLMRCFFINYLYRDISAMAKHC